MAPCSPSCPTTPTPADPSPSGRSWTGSGSSRCGGVEHRVVGRVSLRAEGTPPECPESPAHSRLLGADTQKSSNTFDFLCRGKHSKQSTNPGIQKIMATINSSVMHLMELWNQSTRSGIVSTSMAFKPSEGVGKAPSGFVTLPATSQAYRSSKSICRLLFSPGRYAGSPPHFITGHQRMPLVRPSCRGAVTPPPPVPSPPGRPGRQGWSSGWSSCRRTRGPRPACAPGGRWLGKGFGSPLVLTKTSQIQMIHCDGKHK